MMEDHGAHLLANGIRQHYRIFGSSHGALPIVVVPGITSPAETWSGVAQAIATEARTEVIVLDVRGRGLSESGAHLDYGLDACADDLLAFLAARDIGGATVIAHSFGGRIALRASRGFDRDARLVLIDPPVSGPGRRSRVKPLQTYLDTIALAAAGDLAALRGRHPRLSEADLRRRAEWLPTCDPRAVAVTHAGFEDDDIWPDMKALKAPALLIVAGDHALITPDDIEELRGAAPMLTSVVIDAGHMVPMDNWPACRATLDAFLGWSATPRP